VRGDDGTGARNLSDVEESERTPLDASGVFADDPARGSRVVRGSDRKEGRKDMVGDESGEDLFAVLISQESARARRRIVHSADCRVEAFRLYEERTARGFSLKKQMQR
jgi:hypothetical protein